MYAGPLLYSHLVTYKVTLSTFKYYGLQALNFRSMYFTYIYNL